MFHTSKPAKLNAGDTVAAVSSSWGGPGQFPHRYEAGKQQLAEAFDLRVVEMPNTCRSPEWVAQNPQARAADLMQAFADPKIAGVISTIGGDDSIRILPHLDLEVIRQNPKVFVGYSDTTVSHFACLKAGVGSFYGPSVMAGFGENGGLHEYLRESFRTICFSPQAPGRIEPNAAGWTVEMLDWAEPANQARKRALAPCTGWHWLQGSGSAEGQLIGGCIEVVDWLRGSSVWPDAETWKGAIVFLETSEEAPSPDAVRRMLRSLAAAGALTSAGGLLMGRPGGHNNAASVEDYDRVILGVIRDELGLDRLPVVTNMDFGHTDPMMTLPFGIRARVDSNTQTFSILEAAVR